MNKKHEKFTDERIKKLYLIVIYRVIWKKLEKYIFI